MSSPAPNFTLLGLHRKVMTDAPLKALGTAVGMTGFFILYFFIQNHPVAPVTLMAGSWIDDFIGFQPWTLAPYLSLWLYISLAPALLTDRRQLWGFAVGCAVLSAIGLGIFYLWPTGVQPPEIDWSQHPGFSFLKKTDASGNACPSLHAAFAVFTALWFARLLPLLGAGRIVQIANLLWAGLIVYSTVGTRQHVAIDALCGAVLGAWVGSLNLHVVAPAPGAPSLRRPLFISVAVIKVSAVLLWTIGVPASLCIALFLTAGALALHQIFMPNARELVRVLSRFVPSTPDAREVWLTFDDGPDPEDTPRILDLLDQHNARATFFLIGERAARHPSLVTEIARRGHEVAHHTHTHPVTDFWCASAARIRCELDTATSAIVAAGAPAPNRFRSPVGIKNLLLAPALTSRRLDAIGWTIRSGDSFAHTTEAVVSRVSKHLHSGAVILLHEGPPVRREIRVAAIAAVLNLLRERGYRAVIPSAGQLR